MTSGTIIAVIVAYSSAATIGECVESVAAYGAHRVLVVDNSADLATRQSVEAAGPDVEYWAPPRNIGFAAAANIGVQRIPASPQQWVAVMNPDVTLLADLDPLISEADRQGVPIVSGKLCTPGVPGASNVRPRVTCRSQLLQAFVGSRINRQTLEPLGATSFWVPSVDGAFLLVRRDVWDELDGFDERFELYFEDADLCQRISNGTGILVADVWVGKHAGGDSYEQNRGPAFRAYRCSRVAYMKKHYGSRGRVTATICALVEWATRTLRRCPEGDLVRIQSLRDQLTVAVGGSCSRVLS